MKRRRVVEENDDLDVLDPITGEALVVEVQPSSASGTRGLWTARRRRLQRVRLVCVVLSLGAIGLAAYTGWSIATLRRVERTWQTAMAVDDVRSAVDETIFRELERFDANEDTKDSFLAGVGVGAFAELAKAEAALAGIDVRDDRTVKLRDAMVEALEFRQRQMSPQRRRLGNTPLVAVENQLATELRRWRLAPSSVTIPRLAAADDALRRLRRFADEPTSTTLVAVGPDGRSLVTIDLDASTLERRDVSEQVDRLVALAPDVVLTVSATGVRAYDVAQPSAREPIWERTGAVAFAAPGAEDVWIQDGNDVLRLDRRGGVTAGPFPVPAGMKPVGATRNGLVLSTDPPTGNDDLVLWSPEGDRRTLLGGGVRRLIGVGRDLVIVERRFGPADGPRRLLEYVEVVADTGRTVGVIEFNVPLLSAAQRPGGIEITAAGGPLAGRLARVFRFIIPGSAPVGGPNVSIDPAALAWSPSGNYLFWVTPDGQVAIHDPARRRVGLVRSGDIAALRAIVAFESQR